MYTTTNQVMYSAIILDLDNTLVHAFDVPIHVHSSNKSEYCGDHGTMIMDQFLCFKRPFVDEFIRACFNKYNRVVIWSAGKKNYVLEILQKVFGMFKFDIVLTREECDVHEGGYNKNLQKPCVRRALNDSGIWLENDDHHIVFVDDKIHRIKNYHNIKIVEVDKFETKWQEHVLSGQKRVRPVREHDSHLKRLKIDIL
jgi:TFIIF-interacting CTD phosphatase-like protein